MLKLMIGSQEVDWMPITTAPKDRPIYATDHAGNVSLVSHQSGRWRIVSNSQLLDGQPFNAVGWTGGPSPSPTSSPHSDKQQSE